MQQRLCVLARRTCGSRHATPHTLEAAPPLASRDSPVVEIDGGETEEVQVVEVKVLEEEEEEEVVVVKEEEVVVKEALGW